MENNKQFANKSYWDARFGVEVEYEWFGLDFDDLQSLFSVNADDEVALKSVLMLGTGNSRLPLDMVLGTGDRKKFLHVTSVDFSDVCLEKMKQMAGDDNNNRLEWLVADLRQLPLKQNSFDIVLEKGTLDVFFVGEKNPWNTSEATIKTVDQIMQRVFLA